MRTTTFTPEELAELRRFDAEVDAAPLTYEDWKIFDFVEDLLFPERVKAKEANHAAYERHKEASQAHSKTFYEANREQVAARKKAWYIANRERVRAQQREYGKRKRLEFVIGV